MALVTTTTFCKILAALRKARVAVIQGSAGASKSYSCSQYCFVNALATPNLVVTILNDSYPNLMDSNVYDMRLIMASVGLNLDKYFNLKRMELKLPNGSIIRYRYASDNRDDLGKGRRRDILFIDEANRIGYSAAYQFIMRTKKAVLLAYNPDRKSWIESQLLNLQDPEVPGKPLAHKIIVTWRDNERADKQEIALIESRKSNKEWYKIFSLGLPGTYSDCQVYRYTEVSAVPAGLECTRRGLDFGVSPDATALVDIYIDGPDMYIDERLCEHNLLMETLEGASRPSVADKLDTLGISKETLIVSDTNPKAIADIRARGYSLVPVKKGPKSVSNGIDTVKAYNLKVTARSTNIITGMDALFYKKDHNDKPKQELESHEPDALAALRYGVMGLEYKQVKSKADIARWNRFLPI